MVAIVYIVDELDYLLLERRFFIAYVLRKLSNVYIIIFNEVFLYCWLPCDTAVRLTNI